MPDSASILKTAISHLKNPDLKVLTALLQFFDRFNEPEGLEGILTTHGTSLAFDVVENYLDLLQKHNPEFVEKWRAQHTTDDAESS